MKYKAHRFLNLPSVGVQALDQCTAHNIRFLLTITFKEGVFSYTSHVKKVLEMVSFGLQTSFTSKIKYVVYYTSKFCWWHSQHYITNVFFRTAFRTEIISYTSSLNMPHQYNSHGLCLYYDVIIFNIINILARDI